MATNKKGAKAPPLPVPERVQWIWDEIKHKTMRQLFDPSADKRRAAVAALAEKFNYYDRRQALLVAALFDEPAPSVRRAMLEAIASLRGYALWQDIARMREGAARFIADDDPAVRLALARCFDAMPVALVPEDIAWLDALVPHAQSRDDLRLIAKLASQAAARGVAASEAIALVARVAKHPTEGWHALSAAEILDHEPAMKELLIELTEHECHASPCAAKRLALAFADTANPRAIAALDAYGSRLETDRWVAEVMTGIVDPRRLPALAEEYEAAFDKGMEAYSHGDIIIEALARVPARAANRVVPWAHTLLTSIYVRRETRLRWIRDNRALFAEALSPRLSEYRADYFAWWEHVSPETAENDAVSEIARILDAHPRGALPHHAQLTCEACCALLARVGRAPEGAMALLAKLGARQASHLVSSVLPTVRAMHALGANEEDFAPIVSAYEREALASDKSASSGAGYDPSRSWGAKLRQVAIGLVALRDIDAVRARWSAFLHLWTEPSSLDQRWALMMLAPYANEPDVRALFEEGLRRQSGEVQREAARALGLLWSAA
ncbi:MAG: hypothetical protein JNK05_09360 [Myxococcales bacterium]|nr:hypothetical protein [Myxococcales bacterium]